MKAIIRIIAFLFLVASASCIDPYVPNLKNYNSLLVVEGLITNENSSYKIKLSRTFSQANSIPENVTDANVYITDGDGIKTDLLNCNNGYYKTDSTSFSGVIGQKYTLHIITSDGNEYKSDECTMTPVAGIDKVYYEKGDEISGTLGESFTGLKILLNSTETTGMNQYFRWTFEEVWKFILPGAQQYTYAYVNPTTSFFASVPFLNNVCWKKNQSGDIIINSVLPGGANYINGQEIQFINPLESDRLTQEYSILVKQYSVSNSEYDFWDNLKKAGEAGGDIFALQPFTVISNIHNVNNNNERVLGYFEVSAVSQKRIFITSHDLDPLSLPNYQTDCILIRKSPSDYPGGNPPTWDGIYQMYMATGNYIFVQPELKDASSPKANVSNSDLLKLDFSIKVCALCNMTGFSTKPDFWIDLE
ncbi:MAG: DUF4249 domain-containing protein [Bacteroidales bacterium]|jgi:hypothetical protein